MYAWHYLRGSSSTVKEKYDDLGLLVTFAASWEVTSGVDNSIRREFGERALWYQHYGGRWVVEDVTEQESEYGWR